MLHLFSCVLWLVCTFWDYKKMKGRKVNTESVTTETKVGGKMTHHRVSWGKTPHIFYKAKVLRKPAYPPDARIGSLRASLGKQMKGFLYNPFINEGVGLALHTNLRKTGGSSRYPILKIKEKKSDFRYAGFQGTSKASRQLFTFLQMVMIKFSHLFIKQELSVLTKAWCIYHH